MGGRNCMEQLCLFEVAIWGPMHAVVLALDIKVQNSAPKTGARLPVGMQRG